MGINKLFLCSRKEYSLEHPFKQPSSLHFTLPGQESHTLECSCSVFGQQCVTLIWTPYSLVCWEVQILCSSITQPFKDLKTTRSATSWPRLVCIFAPHSSFYTHSNSSPLPHTFFIVNCSIIYIYRIHQK